MAFGDFKQVFGGLYSLGGARDFTLNDNSSLSSDVLNTRDLGNVGESDFVFLGPGSQVWIVGYSVSIAPPVVLAASALGLFLRVAGSYDSAIPFVFTVEQQIILPVYGTIATVTRVRYTGHVRVESPAVQLSFVNITGEDLIISYQFWAKAF